MITFRASKITDDASQPPDSGTKAAGDTKPIPLLWIPVTLSVGLLLAAIYLGGRILAPHPPGRPAAPQVRHISPPKPAKPEVKEPASPLAAVPKPPMEAPAVANAAAVPDDEAVITPQPGTHYIQVGALNAEATRRFVEFLRREKFTPHIAPGPTPEIERVLIGPFDDLDALKKAKAQLEDKGIDSFIRHY